MPVRGMLNASNLYSTGIPCKESINYMGSLVCPCCCCYSKAAVRCLLWAALYSQSIAIEERPVWRLHWSTFSSQREWVWQLTRFSGRKWKSGLNRISHPDWLKLSVELNCAPNQNTKFSSSLQFSTEFSFDPQHHQQTSIQIQI